MRKLAFILSLALFVSAAEPDLTGLWRAKKVFGPELRGPLTIVREGNTWRAEIAGRAASVRAEGERLAFELPANDGAFRGRLRGGRITGHWIQPPAATAGFRYATPVTLEPLGAGRWRGAVQPLDDEFTFFLPVTRDASGTLRAFLRNPERNLGRWLNFERLVIDGDAVRAVRADGSEVMGGKYDAEAGRLSLYARGRGGYYDFERATPADEALFYPRGKAPAAYRYRPPPLENDGWKVGTLEEAKIPRAAMQQFVQKLIDQPVESRQSLDLHGLLVVRHGKLVLEEYFHGFHRDALHDTRSAAKSLTSVLIGAASLKGIPISDATPVYETMYGPSPDLDPRRRAMTVGHLMMMASGLECDDDNPDSLGQEDRVAENGEKPDWYRVTLDLPMVRQPGEKAAYCSMSPNLAGGVLARVSGRWLPELFAELVAEPMQMRHYAVNLGPTGEGYMGGGVRFQPRDFLKLGQMMMDGGRWNGRQIVSAEWAKRSTSPLIPLRTAKYGYLWWVMEVPYRGRKLEVLSANGNGGQVIAAIPELGLLLGFWGGNYADPAGYHWLRVLVPEIAAMAE